MSLNRNQCHESISVSDGCLKDLFSHFVSPKISQKIREQKVKQLIDRQDLKETANKSFFSSIKQLKNHLHGNEQHEKLFYQQTQKNSAGDRSGSRELQQPSFKQDIEVRTKQEQIRKSYQIAPWIQKYREERQSDNLKTLKASRVSRSSAPLGSSKTLIGLTSSQQRVKKSHFKSKTVTIQSIDEQKDLQTPKKVEQTSERPLLKILKNITDSSRQSKSQQRERELLFKKKIREQELERLNLYVTEEKTVNNSLSKSNRSIKPIPFTTDFNGQLIKMVKDRQSTHSFRRLPCKQKISFPRKIQEVSKNRLKLNGQSTNSNCRLKNLILEKEEEVKEFNEKNVRATIKSGCCIDLIPSPRHSFCQQRFNVEHSTIQTKAEKTAKQQKVRRSTDSTTKSIDLKKEEQSKDCHQKNSKLRTGRKIDEQTDSPRMENSSETPQLESATPQIQTEALYDSIQLVQGAAINCIDEMNTAEDWQLDNQNFGDQKCTLKASPSLKPQGSSKQADIQLSAGRFRQSKQNLHNRFLQGIFQGGQVNQFGMTASQVYKRSFRAPTKRLSKRQFSVGQMINFR